jgi:hypothetical protein
MNPSGPDAIRRLFSEWPTSIPRTGLVLTTFGETIPFASYMLADGLLLIERKTPDAQGARRIIMPFEQIYAVKILESIEMSRFRAMGFKAVSQESV